MNSGTPSDFSNSPRYCVAIGLRADEGVHRCRREALVFPNLRRDLGRSADCDPDAAFFPRHLFCPLFVNRIAIAIEEHDGDRFDAARFQFSGRLTHSILIQGQYDLAVRSDPLLHHFT